MPTLTAIRRAFASEPPFVATVGTTGALSGGSYVGVPNGSNASRQIISSDLADTAFGGGALSDSAADFFQGGWSYLPALALQRRIAADSYVPSVAANTVLDAGGTVIVGHLTAAQAFASPLAANQVWEYHPLLPIVARDRLPGIHSVINRALRSMRIVKRVSFTGNGGNRYALTSYPWITKESQVGPSWKAETATDTEPALLPGGATLRFDGAALYLITGQRQRTDVAFAVDFYRPAHTYIKVAGTWGDSTAGLVNESDEALPDLDDIVSVARYWAFLALSRYASTKSERDRWNEMARDQRMRAAAYMLGDQPEHIVSRQGWTTPRAQSALSRAPTRVSWP